MLISLGPGGPRLPKTMLIVDRFLTLPTYFVDLEPVSSFILAEDSKEDKGRVGRSDLSPLSAIYQLSTYVPQFSGFRSHRMDLKHKCLS